MRTKKQQIELKYKGNEKHLFKLRHILLSLCLLTFIGGYSQTGRINLNLKNATVKELFSIIEKQTSYRFSYRDAEIRGKGSITITKENAELKDVLTNELVKVNLKYYVSGQKIIITPVNSVKTKPTSKTPQQKITGNVIDTNGMPIIGATVMEKGTNNGTITDFNGNFSFNASPNSTLDISYIGYKTQSIKAIAGKLLAITLKEDTEVLEEVVVVGYGQQKKESLVGSIVATKGEDLLKTGSVNSVSEALQGQLPGVIAENSSSKPGADAASIFIRGKATWGDATPLVLVDGVERNFNDVDINEIESISVLKDASATAVYGVKGANGVILLTTKRGDNKAPVVNFSANFGFKQPTVNMQFADYPVAQELFNEAAINDGQWNKLIPETTISAWKNAFATGNYGPYNDYFPQVNWWDEVMSNFGFQQNYNVNVRGGTERMGYFVSLGMLNDGDIYKTEKQSEYDPRFYYKRYNWRTNFDFKITRTTSLAVNIAGKVGFQNQPGYRTGDAYFFDEIIKTPQNLFPIKYSDGVWGADQTGQSNVVARLNNLGQRQAKSFQGIYDVVFKQNLDFITKGLNFKASISYNTASQRNTAILKAGYYGVGEDVANQNAFKRYHREYDYTKPILDESGNIIGYDLILEDIWPDDGQLEEDLPIVASHDNFKSYSRQLYYELSLNYNRKFKEHNVSALLLFNRRINDYCGGGAIDFPSYSEDWVGRVTYNWKQRYLTEINAAYTGSEKFAPGKRFGFFPSFSFGWRITEEAFMKDIREKWLTNLKIRYSYGKVGSDKGAPRFNYIQKYNSGGNVSFGKDQNYTYGPIYTEGTLAYYNATWETATKQNLGIDMTIIDKLKMTLDLFNEKRTGILMPRQTAGPWMGVSLPSMNMGETKNHGMEVELSWFDKIGKDFSYSLKFNFSTSENRVVFKDDPADMAEHLKSEGNPIQVPRKYIVSGNLNSIDDIFNYTTSNLGSGTQNTLVPGDLAYIDYDANGVIDVNDIVPMKYLNYPLTSYGFNLGVNYKGLSLNALFYAATDIYKEQIGTLLWDFDGGKVIAQPDALERWTESTQSNTKIIRPSVHLSNSYNSQQSTYTYVNHSYLRLKNLEISYSIPKKYIKKVGLSNCQVYVNGNNLFTISNIDKRRDPETGSASVYPIVRRYNVGTRITF